MSRTPIDLASASRILSENVDADTHKPHVDDLFRSHVKERIDVPLGGSGKWGQILDLGNGLFVRLDYDRHDRLESYGLAETGDRDLSAFREGDRLDLFTMTLTGGA